MAIAKRDYETRKARVDAGEGSDDDARLVKQYERAAPPTEPGVETPATTAGGDSESAGSSTKPSAEPPPTRENSSSGNRRSRARTTANP